MPNARFMRDMGVASIVAGIVLLGLASIHPRKLQRRLRRK